MTVISGLGWHLRILARLLREAQVSGICERVALLLDCLPTLIHAKRPDTPEDRQRWDVEAAPALAFLTSCDEIARTMTWPVVRSGQTWNPTWLVHLLADVREYLRIRPLDEPYAAAAAAAHAGPVYPTAPPRAAS